MAFLEQRLSSRIERGATGGPVNRGRRLVRTGAGKLVQVFSWALPRREYTVSHGVLRENDRQALRDLWYVVNFTPYEGFRFRDWADFTATQGSSRLALIGGTDFQLQRVYAYAGSEHVRKIVKPNAGVVIWRTRGPSTTVAAGAVVSTTTGVVSIADHQAGDAYTWEGQFDVPVTFSGDEWVEQLEAMASDGVIATMPQLKLEEIAL